MTFVRISPSDDRGTVRAVLFTSFSYTGRLQNLCCNTRPCRLGLNLDPLSYPHSSMADIKSVASEHTWGTFNTAEDTVVANNVRTPKKEPGKKTPQQLSGGSASHSTVRAFSPTESYSVSSSKDSSSLFDLGSIDSSTYSQYASGSSISKKMKEAVASVGGGGMSNNSDNVDCNEASGITSWMNYFTCGDSSEMFSEEREGRTGDGRYNNMVDGGRQESPKNRQNHGSPISTPEDALLLQKALRDSTSTPRSRKPRNTANIGSLDIVMELQQQEHTTPKAGLKTRLRNLSVGRRRTIDGDVSSRPKSISKSSRELSQGTASTKSSKRKGLKKTSESSKADLLLADDRTDIGAIRIVQSKSSDHSVFDFEKEENKSKKPPMKSKRVNWINGPALGTYLNVSTASNAVHPELAHTYSTFRADKPSIDMVLSRVKCSVPLYHQTDTNKHAQLLMSMSSESEESAKLPIDVKHVCSEPVATTFDVRSQSYLADGQKQHSEESMFALLGTDSLLKNEVQGYRASDVSKISSSYFNRLKTATKRLGLDTPFL